MRYQRVCVHLERDVVYVFGELTEANGGLPAGAIYPVGMFSPAEIGEAVELAEQAAIEHQCKLGCASGIIRED
jgi:hypothetical protein